LTPPPACASLLLQPWPWLPQRPVALGKTLRIRKPDVRDVSGMLVERVFLVSGVVKTVFSPNKKILEFFFLFLPRTKKSKADFVGISRSPLFVRGVVKTMFYGEHDENTLFSTENTRDTGHNFLRNMFPSLFLFAGKNSMRG
jgi:hypothetical protein